MNRAKGPTTMTFMTPSTRTTRSKLRPSNATRGDTSRSASERLRPIAAARPSLFVLLVVLLAVLPFTTACLDEQAVRDTAPRPDRRYTPPKPNVLPANRVPLEQAVRGQRIYVPVYSHVYYAGGKPYLLEATLSVRNTDPERRITINSVEYYDSEGTWIRGFLEAPLTLAPLATTEFLIPSHDTQGGAGANFLVEWVSEGPVATPLVECMMAGMSGTHGLSFARSGHVIVDKR